MQTNNAPAAFLSATQHNCMGRCILKSLYFVTAEIAWCALIHFFDFGAIYTVF